MSPGLKWRSSILSSLSEHLTATKCLQPCRRSSWLPGRSWKHLPLFFSAAFLVLPFPFAFMRPIFVFVFVFFLECPHSVFTALSLVGYDINVEQRILICFYCVFLGFCLKLRLLLLIIRPEPFDCIVCCEKKIFYTRDDSRVALHGY